MEWQASAPRGYGTFKHNGFAWRAHRLALLLSGVSFPEEAQVLHRCDNTKCVNPLHLFLGDHDLNMQDKIAKGRDHNQKKTHCPNGHEYSGDNLYVNPKGSRKCKACLREADKKHYAQNAEEIRAKKRVAVLKYYHENRESILQKRKERAALSRLKGGVHECTNKN